jgi:PTS system sucrose-specific IIC component
MYNAIEMAMLADNGQNIWMPIATAANVAQGAAALAIAIKTKNKKTKSMALPASLSAFMGITEPAIFGVNIRFMRPFVAGCIGGACGAVVASIMKVYATANGVTGLFGFLITTNCFVGYLLTFAVAFAVAFIISWILGIKEEVVAEEVSNDAPTIAASAGAAENIISAPLTGKAIPMKDVDDPTFSAEVLGQGAAIEPTEGKVVAPGNGVVETIFETKHAIGLTMDNGMELLIHVGINTVELNGEGYEAHVKDGDHVTAGQTLITFDMDKIKSKGYKLTTPVIVTNTADYAEVRMMAAGNVSYPDQLVMAKK